MTVVERIEQASGLDPVSDRLQRLVDGLPRPVRDLLHGVWLGHPLHPALIHAPIGAWLSAAILDLIPGQRRAATMLLATGTAAAVPAAVAGLNDWASLGRDQRRTGLVHALANVTAVALYTGSLVSRSRGGSGRALGFAAFGIAGASAYLGGHMSYRQGAAVNQAVPDLFRVPDGWQPLGEAMQYQDGQAVERRIGDVPVLVYRHRERFSVLLAHCGHQTGPLGEGERTEVAGQACIVCPWHGSTFRLADGGVVHGPAATDQPTLLTRVVDGHLQACRP
jgi:nitrite reductase/ring-hydroxylating ferredoxin subunit